ncbi:HNH endonuclease signature motif containing protein [Brevundimonas sp. M1A4_2e]
METNTCRKCDATLDEDNWFASFRKANNRICSPCQREAGREARAKYQASYQRKPRKNPPGNAEAVRRYCESHPDRKREAALKYRNANLESCRQYARDYARLNPEKGLARAARRRAACRVDLTPEEQSRVLALYDLAARLKALTGDDYHVDHIVPLAKGGLHHPDNMVVMLADLNRRKHARRWPALERHFLALA